MPTAIDRKERSFLYVFARLKTQVEYLVDILNKKKLNEDDLTNLESTLNTLSYLSKNISYLSLTESEWDEIKSGKSGTWMEYRGALVKRIIPSVIISLKKITKERINKGIQIDILKERVNLLSSTISGLSSDSILKGDN